MYRETPGGILNLEIKRVGDILEIIVEDNGVGREASAAMHSRSALKRKSHGMKITGEQLDIVSMTYNANTSVAVSDLHDEINSATGTRVQITLNYIQNKNGLTMKAIIVDDEKHCRESLQALLQRHCPQVEIVASCADAMTAISAIEQHKPDVVFLDIEMPRMVTFDLLARIPDIDFRDRIHYSLRSIRHPCHQMQRIGLPPQTG